MHIANKILTIIANRVIQTIVILGSYIYLADSLELHTHKQFYTISLLIKEILLWLMPITICMFAANTVRSFGNKAFMFIVIMVIFETCSNFSCIWYSYIAATLISGANQTFDSSSLKEGFDALWSIPIKRPGWYTADKGMFIGLIFGIGSTLTESPSVHRSITKSYKFMHWLLTKVFARLTPIFILGFVAKMYNLNLLNYIMSYYSNLIAWIVFFLVIYILFLFALGSGGSLMKMISDIKNLLPAGAVAITSGCSLSTMPWTIKGAGKNLDNKDFASAVIPATTNIQQIGDCIINSFLCFLIYKNFYGANPDLVTWLQFSVIFVLARFVTAAVIGGAIFIMLPIYETYLHFNSEMIAIILALNVVLDPLVTSFNVVANGALCRVFEIVWNKALKFLRSKKNI